MISSVFAAVHVQHCDDTLALGPMNLLQQDAHHIEIGEVFNLVKLSGQKGEVKIDEIEVG